MITAFCQKIDPDPIPGRLELCLLWPKHTGRCTWDICGDPGGTDGTTGIACGRPRGHKRLHSMTW